MLTQLFFEFKGSSHWIGVSTQHVLCWGADRQQRITLNGLLLCICANNLGAVGWNWAGGHCNKHFVGSKN